MQSPLVSKMQKASERVSTAMSLRCARLDQLGEATLSPGLAGESVIFFRLELAGKTVGAIVQELGAMMHEMTTSLAAAEVLERAKSFFAGRIPHNAAFLEKEGPGFATFRGQGGEEIALAVFEGPDGVMVRASSMLHEQAIGRFFSTLPAAEQGQ